MLDNDSLLARFEIEHFDRNSISEGRRKETRVVLARLASGMEGRSLGELTPGDLMGWQAVELRDRKLAPSTLGKYEAMIGAFITWAHQAGVIGFEHYAMLKAVKPPRGVQIVHRPRPYKRRELMEFRDALAQAYPLAPDRGKGSLMVKRYLQGKSPFKGTIYCHSRRLQVEAQVSLALEEGLRRAEIYAMTLDRLSPENAAVVVASVKQRPGEVKMREVPWTEHSRRAVTDWLEFRELLAPPHDRPWLSLHYNNPTDPQTFDRFRRGLDRFAVDGWHRFRHTFATERLRAGMPLEQVQVMMGHANLAQVLAYAQIVNSDVATHAAASEAAFVKSLGLEAA